MLSSPSGSEGRDLARHRPSNRWLCLDGRKGIVAGLSLADLARAADAPGIIIGKGWQPGSGLTLGNRVSLLSPSGKKTAAGFSPKILFFTVVGIFHSGMYEYDSSLAFVSIPSAQQVLGFETDVITGIEYKVSDIDNVQLIGDMLVRSLGGFPYYSRNWIEMNQNLFSALKLEKTAMAVILIMIVLVGSFSIITTLVMMVMEKNKDIAVLMALGATPAQSQYFHSPGISDRSRRDDPGLRAWPDSLLLLQKYQFIKLPSDVYYLDHLPVKMKFWTSHVSALPLLHCASSPRSIRPAKPPRCIPPRPCAMNDIYRLQRITKEYQQGEATVTVLKSLDLVVGKGDSLAVVGASGSGKSTLLQIMGTLDVPSSGSIFFNDEDISTLGWKERAIIRNRHIGFVFQFHHLLPEFSTRENVAMPGIIGGMLRGKALAKADEALHRVGLAHRLHHRVTTLSGGERQRAAIARAILLEPEVVLADRTHGQP
jgi:ABC-type lipoprotein export system ATPase subunit